METGYYKVLSIATVREGPSLDSAQHATDLKPGDIINITEVTATFHKEAHKIRARFGGAAGTAHAHEAGWISLRSHIVEKCTVEYRAKAGPLPLSA
eukprot:SAG22_NODE_9241_length_601_cov_0.936255_1_plen_95_part_01